jgi:hypothetical protein
MEFIEEKYNTLSNTESDINEHLPTLYKYATECESIIELGVRGCISSWAFTLGLLINIKSQLNLLIKDIFPWNIAELLSSTKELNIDIEYQWVNDLELNITENVDLTFIDTWHVYGQLKRELNKFAPITNKYIIMHDTTVDEIVGESIRCNMDYIRQSEISGMPVNEIICGLGLAISEFLANNKDWVLKKKFTNNNGLTILERI